MKAVSTITSGHNQSRKTPILRQFRKILGLPKKKKKFYCANLNEPVKYQLHSGWKKLYILEKSVNPTIGIKDTGLPSLSYLWRFSNSWLIIASQLNLLYLQRENKMYLIHWEKTFSLAYRVYSYIKHQVDVTFKSHLLWPFQQAEKQLTSYIWQRRPWQLPFLKNLI